MDADLLALCADPCIVEVVEGTARALPPLRCAADGQGAVFADREAARVDGACLWGTIELELLICDYGACAAVRVAEDAVVEVANQGAVCCLLGWMLVCACVGWVLDGERGCVYLHTRLALMLMTNLQRPYCEVAICIGLAIWWRSCWWCDAFGGTLGQCCRREEEWSEDVGSAHLEVVRCQKFDRAADGAS